MEEIDQPPIQSHQIISNIYQKRDRQIRVQEQKTVQKKKVELLISKQNLGNQGIKKQFKIDPEKLQKYTISTAKSANYIYPDEKIQDQMSSSSMFEKIKQKQKLERTHPNFEKQLQKPQNTQSQSQLLFSQRQYGPHQQEINQDNSKQLFENLRKIDVIYKQINQKSHEVISQNTQQAMDMISSKLKFVHEKAFQKYLIVPKLEQEFFESFTSLELSILQGIKIIQNEMQQSEKQRYQEQTKKQNLQNEIQFLLEEKKNLQRKIKEPLEIKKPDEKIVQINLENVKMSKQLELMESYLQSSNQYEKFQKIADLQKQIQEFQINLELQQSIIKRQEQQIHNLMQKQGDSQLKINQPLLEDIDALNKTITEIQESMQQNQNGSQILDD